MRGVAVVAVVVSLVTMAAACGDDDSDAGRQHRAATPPAAKVAAARSAGCDASAARVGPGETKVTVRSGGTSRWYLRHVPPARGKAPLPVVIDLHGYLEGAAVHAANTGLGAYGDREGFVTLTPQGQGKVAFWDTRPGSPDVGFVAAILDDAERALCVDTNRVFATGYSNGAMMASTLACVLADRIAAVAPVAGVAEVPDCSTRPVPVVAFHGTADPFLSYRGGFGPGVAKLPTPDGKGSLGNLSADQAADMQQRGAGNARPVPDILAAWAGRNGCRRGKPVETKLARDVTKLAFRCPAGADVELYRVDGGGHTWPGSTFLAGAADLVGPTTRSIRADDIMWAFFRTHPLTIRGAR